MAASTIPASSGQTESRLERVRQGVDCLGHVGLVFTFVPGFAGEVHDFLGYCGHGRLLLFILENQNL